MRASVRSFFRPAAAVSVSAVLTGCSLFAPWKEKLTVDSEPQGATVIIPGRPRLTTPATVIVPCDEDLTAVIRKDGYYPQTYTIRRTIGKCGVLDIVGTVVFLAPVVGLISPGAYTLDQHNIFSVLTPVHENPPAAAR